jgi:hypothetical protein
MPQQEDPPAWPHRRRFGELDYRWVATEEAWTYKTSFNLTKQQLGHEELHLLLSGVDTFADILVNDKPVARTKNLFREYYMPVKHALREGSNSLTIALSSPITAAAEAKARYPYDLPAVTAPGECSAAAAGHVAPLQPSTTTCCTHFTSGAALSLCMPCSEVDAAWQCS